MLKLKLKRFLAVVIIVCLPLSGCYDANEIDEQVYALVIGVDKGVDNMIRVTFQYATYKEGGGSKGSSGGSGGGDEDMGQVDGTIVSSVEAPSLLEGINMLNAAVNREVSLMHTKMLVFSEEYAREGVGKYIDPLVRFRETREFMRIVVCKGRAEEFIKENRTFIGANPAKAIELMFEQSKKTGYFPDMIFSDFYIDLLTPYGQAVASYAAVNDMTRLKEVDRVEVSPLDTNLDIPPGELPRKGGTRKELFGTAIFDGDKMVGSLLQNETRFYLMAIGEFKNGYFTITDPEVPENIIVIDIKESGKPQTKARFENGVPIIDFKIVLDANLISIQSRKQYEKLGYVEKLESIIEQHFHNGMKETIEKTQQEFNSDIFHFGKKVAGNFNTIQEFNDYNWIKHYRDAKINVNIDVKLNRAGSVYGAMPIRSTGSEQGEDAK